MSRNSRSDAHMELWLKLGDAPRPEAELTEFHHEAVRMVRELAERYGYSVYAEDFVVKDGKVVIAE